MRYIDTLTFESTPNYSFLRQQLWSMLLDTGLSAYEPYDWEREAGVNHVAAVDGAGTDERDATESAKPDPIVPTLVFSDHVRSGIDMGLGWIVGDCLVYSTLKGLFGSIFGTFIYRIFI